MMTFSRSMHIAAAVLLVCITISGTQSYTISHNNAFAHGDTNEIGPLEMGENRRDDRPTDHAKVARDIVHNAEWTALGTNSASAKGLNGFPMVNVISMADSKRGAPSTGDIYFLLTNLDFTGQDLMKSNRVTMLFSRDQNLECRKQQIDPMEPTCSRVMISGQAIMFNSTTSDEYKFGFNAFVDHHPAAIKWIEEHDFYLCKLEIQSVIVLDWYGGPHYVPVLDYYRYKDAAANGANKEWTNSALWKRQTVTTDGGNDKRKVRIHLERDTNDLVIEM